MNTVTKVIKQVLQTVAILGARFIAAPLLLPPATKQSKHAIRSILVYCVAGIGNTLLFTPALKKLREHVPNASLHVVYIKGVGSEDVLKSSGLFQKYWGVEQTNSLVALLQLAWKIRSSHFDVIINDFHGQYWILQLAVLISKAPIRIGHVTGAGLHNRFSWLYNHPVVLKTNRHEIDLYFDLIDMLVPSVQRSNRSLIFNIQETDETWARTYMSTHIPSFQSMKLISIQIGSTYDQKWKRWPQEKFRELSGILLRDTSHFLLFHGTAKERAYIEDTTNTLDPLLKKRLLITAGSTTLSQTATLLRYSTLLICNDSGLMHVAVATGTPVIALYGPTDYRRTAPEKNCIIRTHCSCSPCFQFTIPPWINDCPYSYACLQDIRVDQVAEETFRTLNRIQRQRSITVDSSKEKKSGVEDK